MNWREIKAAIYRAKKDELKAVIELDDVCLDELVGLEEQKRALLENTRNFLKGKNFHHALLWGAKGTGKSSLIKAVFNEFKDEGLRLVELAKQDLQALTEIIDELRLEPYKFIIFCDDFSFEAGDETYQFLKPLLEGSIEKAPRNIVLYASSNRRHLLAENSKDNEATRIEHGELHLSDMAEERLSLSDRFGLWLSFYAGSFDEYLQCVDFYFKDYKGDKSLLHAKAREFSMLRASRSPRTAKQFYLSFMQMIEN